MILVTGATGNVGRHVVTRLLAAGQQVRALTRDPARATLPAGAEVVAGDLSKPETLPPALAGVRRAYLLLSGPDTRLFADAAKAAGVEHVVVLSSLAAGLDLPGNAIGEGHLRGESAVRDAGLAWTFLRPGGFASNTLTWAPGIRAEGVVRAGFADIPNPLIDPDDIAAVAVAALTEPGHEGRVYPMTGPVALTPRQQVAAIANAIGREVRFEEQSEDEARAAMARYLPAPLIDALIQFNREPRTAEVLTTVAEVIGRPARPFAAWAAEHADQFR